jgi:hypothetical protein
MAKKMNASLEKRNNIQNVITIADGFYYPDPFVIIAKKNFLQGGTSNLETLQKLMLMI